MTLSILRNIARNIKHGVFCTIMADEFTNSSSKEQFVMCLRWVEKYLNLHEEFIGPHEVPNISASPLASCIWDALIHVNLSFNKCRDQCYDAVGNMTGAGSGVTRQVKNQEPRTVSTHCYGHSLQLAVGDMIKIIKNIKDAMNTNSEILNYGNFPKNVMRSLEH